MPGISASIGSIWIKLTSEIAASTGAIVDETPSSDFHSIDYILTFWNDSQNKTKTLNIKLTNRNGTLKKSVYAKNGDNINYDLTFTLSTGNVIMTLTNNETYAINISIAKLIL